MFIRSRYNLIRTQIRNRSSHWRSTQLLFSEEKSLNQALKGEHGSELSEVHTDPQSLIGQAPPGYLGSDGNSDFT